MEKLTNGEEIEVEAKINDEMETEIGAVIEAEMETEIDSTQNTLKRPPNTEIETIMPKTFKK